MSEKHRERVSLKGKTLFIAGASRGIGLAIALRAAAEGANIIIAAKTDKPHPKLPGTIHSAAKEIWDSGGRALPLAVDIRDEDHVRSAVEQGAERYGGIDILVCNASAVQLSTTPETDMKRFDLMHQVNTRGTFLCGKACYPYLKKSDNPHILSLSPPLDFSNAWWGAHLPYTMAKYGMSLCIRGWAEEFRKDGIACNALWPRTFINTSAMQILVDEEHLKQTRKPDIVADAAYHILTRPSHDCTGNFFLDEEVLAQEGITDFTPYAVDPTQELIGDFFLDEAGEHAGIIPWRPGKRAL